MITKSQLRNKLDKDNRFTWTHEVPWNETHLARLYDAADAQIEGGCLVDIVSAEPTAIDFERGTILVEMVLDCSDLLDGDGPSFEE